MVRVELVAQILLCFASKYEDEEKCRLRHFISSFFASQERNKVLLDRVRKKDLKRSGDLTREISHEKQNIEISLKVEFEKLGSKRLYKHTNRSSSAKNG